MQGQAGNISVRCTLKDCLDFLLQIFRGSAAERHYRRFDAKTIEHRNKLVKNNQKCRSETFGSFPLLYGHLAQLSKYRILIYTYKKINHTYNNSCC